MSREHVFGPGDRSREAYFCICQYCLLILISYVRICFRAGGAGGGRVERDERGGEGERGVVVGGGCEGPSERQSDRAIQRSTKLSSDQPIGRAIERPHHRTATRPHDFTTARPHDRMTPRPHDRTTARPHNLASGPHYHHHPTFYNLISGANCGMFLLRNVYIYIRIYIYIYNMYVYAELYR